MRGVISIDPGTRNLAVCWLAYEDGALAATTMEQFLSNITLRSLSFVDLGTAHVDTATVRFQHEVRDGQLSWIRDTARDYDVVIERQGSISSPINFLCHAMQGFFLGLGVFDDDDDAGRLSTIYVNYPAANKFRGDWTLVQPRDNRRLELEDTKHTCPDPVKRAAVECCERMMSWFRDTPADMLSKVKAERRQHDMCDCILQGVSYLFRHHVQKMGTTQRARPSLTLHVDNPTLVTETMLGQPRKGRKKETQTTAKRSKTAKRKLFVEDEEDDDDPLL